MKIDLKKELKELQSGRREMELDGYGKVYIENPTLPVSKKADEIHSKVLNEGLRNKDELLESEILAILKERGVWTDKEEAEVENISNEINLNVTKLANLKKGDLAASEIVKEVSALRSTRNALQQKRDQFTENSVETKARTARENFLIRSCVKYTEDADGHKAGDVVWTTEDAMFGDTRKNAMTLVNQSLAFMYSLPSNPAALFPENVVLDSLNETETESNVEAEKPETEVTEGQDSAEDETADTIE